jgi:hypothetical protein
MNFVALDDRITIDPINNVYNFPAFSAPNVDTTREAALLFRVNPELDATGHAEWEMTLNGIQIFHWTHNTEAVRGWVEVVEPGALQANNALVATEISGTITFAELVFLYKD